MLDWWNALQPLQQILYVVAIPATLILLLQTILTLIGFTQDGGGDVDHDGSIDHDGGFDHDSSLDHGEWDHGGCEQDHDFSHDTDGHDADHPGDWHLITIRGVVAFLTLFGWVGIALLDMHVPAVLSIFLALVAGFIAMFVVAILLKVANDLQQSGNLDTMNAIGLTGEVYAPDSGKRQRQGDPDRAGALYRDGRHLPRRAAENRPAGTGDRRRGKRRAGGHAHRLIPIRLTGGDSPD